MNELEGMPLPVVVVLVILGLVAIGCIIILRREVAQRRRATRTCRGRPTYGTTVSFAPLPASNNSRSGRSGESLHQTNRAINPASRGDPRNGRGAGYGLTRK
jgi:hypothetical protein